MPGINDFFHLQIFADEMIFESSEFLKKKKYDSTTKFEANIFKIRRSDGELRLKMKNNFPQGFIWEHLMASWCSYKRLNERKEINEETNVSIFFHDVRLQSN